MASEVSKRAFETISEVLEVMVLVTSETILVAPRREFVGEKECRLLEWRAELHL